VSRSFSSSDPNLAFSLKQFRIDFDHDGWNNELHVDVEENPCVILAGRNSGGKTVTMRSLEKFSNLLSNPSEHAEEVFASFAQNVKLQSLRVRYEYQWLNYNPRSHNKILSLEDATRVPWLGLSATTFASGDEYYESPIIERGTYSGRIGSKIGELPDIRELSLTGHVSVEYEIKCKTTRALEVFSVKELKDKLRDNNLPVSGIKSELMSRLEEFDDKHRRKNFSHEITRRDGIRIDSSCTIGEKARSFSEIIQEDWRPWGQITDDFDDFSRMDSFGPRETVSNSDITPTWVVELKERTGIEIDYRPLLIKSGEDYDFHDAEKMLRFSIINPIFQEVSEAYDVSETDKNRLKKKFAEWDTRGEAFLARIFQETYSQKHSLCNQNFQHFFKTQASHFLPDWGLTVDDGIESLTPTQANNILTKFADQFGLLDVDQEIEDSRHFNRLLATMMSLHHYIDMADPEQGNFTPEDYDNYDHESSDQDKSAIEMIQILKEDLGGKLPDLMVSKAIERSSDFGLWLVATEDQESNSGKDIRDWLNSSHLSSGRLRYLSLLIALLDLTEQTVVMIDEPELSLHIDWQETLIEDLSNNLPHLKFIWATHSPSIVQFHTDKIHPIPPSDDL